MNTELISSKNGLKVLLIHLEGSATSHAQIWFRAGSALESENSLGMAHFLEHMFFKGTEQRPSGGIASEVENNGGEINAFTSFDYTCYYINSSNEQLSQSTELLLDMITGATFKPEELEPEKMVVTEEYLRSIDNPGQYSFNQIQNLCFPLPYRHSILGTQESIAHFNREDLINFKNRFYNNQNCLLVLAGDLAHKKNLIEIVNRFQLPQGNENIFSDFTIRPQESLRFHHKDVTNIQLSIIVQSEDYLDAISAQQDLFLNCIGSGETSHIYKRLIHKKSLANHCSVSSMFMNKNGCYIIRLSFPPKNTHLVMQELRSIFQDAYTEGLLEEEINKIKSQYVSSKIFEKESLEQIAFSYGQSFALKNDIACEERFLDNIKQAKLNDVNKSIKFFINKKICLSVQLPNNVKINQVDKFFKSFIASYEKISQSTSLHHSQKKLTKKSPYDANTTIFQLGKEVEFIYRQNKQTPTFVLQAYIQGGLKDENEKNNGFSNLISSLLAKGYNDTKYWDLQTYLENNSASLSGISGRNTYGLALHGKTENIQNLFHHFFGSLLYPTFPKEHLKQEITMIKRILKSQEKDPAKQGFRQFSNIIFKNHHYSYNIIGNDQSIKKIGSLNLSKIHYENLLKKRMVITYCGDSELEDIIHLIQKNLLLTPIYSKRNKIKKSIKVEPKAYFGQNSHLEFKREQAHIIMGLPACKMGHKNEKFFRILNSYLSGQSSPLFTEIRDKRGLCYTVQPVYFSALEGGYWAVYMATNNKNKVLAQQELKHFFTNFAQEGITEEQFSIIKKMIHGQTKLSLITNEDYASSYSIPVLHGFDFDYNFKLNEDIQLTKIGDFKKFLKIFFSQEWNTILVSSSKKS